MLPLETNVGLHLHRFSLKMLRLALENKTDLCIMQSEREGVANYS